MGEVSRRWWVSAALVVALLGALLARCCCGSPTPPPDSRVDRAQPDAPGPDQRQGGDSGGRWVIAYEETFEEMALPAPSWGADTYPDDGPFSDNGIYFQQDGITPPEAFRATAAFGRDGWLTAEFYSRSSTTVFTSLAAIVPDPAAAGNKVLRIASPAHTDATVVRPTAALPERYRVSMRVGFADFGDGKAGGQNGYDDDEQAEPWIAESAITENGFYWLTILDAPPRPHNNVWIHHHRKVVIDSDNHYPPWMEIWDGSSFTASGEHPVMVFAVDGRGKGYELSGKPFLSYSAGAWQPSGEIRAVDAYKPDTWYRVSIERQGDSFTLQVAGDFRFGGNTTYTATIDAAEQCVFHYNRQPLGASSPCVDNGHYPSLGAQYPSWPPDVGYPDYFMFGDPHSNYYEGKVYYDDLRLEIWVPQ
jgi:hypothetical protein